MRDLIVQVLFRGATVQMRDLIVQVLFRGTSSGVGHVGRPGIITSRPNADGTSVPNTYATGHPDAPTFKCGTEIILLTRDRNHFHSPIILQRNRGRRGQQSEEGLSGKKLTHNPQTQIDSLQVVAHRERNNFGGLLDKDQQERNNIILRAVPKVGWFAQTVFVSTISNALRDDDFSTCCPKLGTARRYQSHKALSPPH